MMRGITLIMMAFLAMTSVTFGVTLQYTITDNAPGGNSGFRTAVISATGTGLNVLYEFSVTGNVNQVWTYDTGTSGYVQSEWIYNDNGFTPANALDSHVLFGAAGACDRLGDLPNSAPGTGSTVTIETNTGVDPGDQSPMMGLGTLNNVGGAVSDAYFLEQNPPPGETTVDLLQLIIPDGQSVSVDLTLFSAEYDAVAGWFTDITEYTTGTPLVVNSFTGDCNNDGVCSGSDYDAFGNGWYNLVSPITWASGDFTGDNDCTGVDYDLFGNGWYSLWGSGGGASIPGSPAGMTLDVVPPPAEASAVPEPGTIIMLVLGTLCLAGYRLRK